MIVCLIYLHLHKLINAVSWNAMRKGDFAEVGVHSILGSQVSQGGPRPQESHGIPVRHISAMRSQACQPASLLVNRNTTLIRFQHAYQRSQ